MARPTRMVCDTTALLHNLSLIKRKAPHQKIVAIVKANAYGCGIENIIPALEGHVDAYGVSSYQEAVAVRQIGSRTDCVLLQGAYTEEEFEQAAAAGFQCVIHHQQQLDWVLAKPLSKPIQLWVKVDTGMHRLGFAPNEVGGVVRAIKSCSWVSQNIHLMTHFACADKPFHEANHAQLMAFHDLELSEFHLTRTLANSAAILSMPEALADVVRPGIMLYGVSPFEGQVGNQLGLMPVMQFLSQISAIHYYPANTPIGYGHTWSVDTPSIIGVVPVGYADGYPRRIEPHTPTWVGGSIAPIVGRVSMDMLMVDLTQCPHVKIGDSVELWGKHIPVEVIAKSAGTIAYELLTKITPRVRVNGHG